MKTAVLTIVAVLLAVALGALTVCVGGCSGQLAVGPAATQPSSSNAKAVRLGVIVLISGVQDGLAIEAANLTSKKATMDPVKYAALSTAVGDGQKAAADLMKAVVNNEVVDPDVAVMRALQIKSDVIAALATK